MSALKSNTVGVWLMWGIFDVLYVLRYIFNSLLQGRIPYIQDLQASIQLLSGRDVSTYLLASASWVLNLSIIISSILFLGRWRIAKWLAWLQIPLRLLFFVPSVSILFMGGNPVTKYGVVTLLVLLGLSECLKLWTLWATRESSSLR